MVYLPSCSIQSLSYTRVILSVSIFVLFLFQLLYIVCHCHLPLFHSKYLYFRENYTFFVFKKIPLSNFPECTLLSKYLHIPAHVAYPVNTLEFKKYIQRQVGRLTFHTRHDRSQLVIVDSESQAKAMLTLKDFDGKTFPSAL